jgi:hypothetical protein
VTNEALSFWRSTEGYGWSITFGKRVRWCSRKALTPMWPRIYRGGDENCNRAISLHLWPIGGLDVWWEPKWRTDADGPCATCRAESIAEGLCEWCGCRPCMCETYYPQRLSTQGDTE